MPRRRKSGVRRRTLTPARRYKKRQAYKARYRSRFGFTYRGRMAPYPRRIAYQGISGGRVPLIQYAKMNWEMIGNYIVREAASGNYCYFNLNSVYRPFGGTDTHQPMMFDYWCGLYNRFKVQAVKYWIFLDAANGDGPLATDCSPQLAYSYVSEGAGTLLSAAPTNAQVEAFLESQGRRPTTRTAWLTNTGTTGGVNRSSCVLSGYVNLNRVVPLYGESPNFACSSTANPATISYLTVGLADPVGGTPTDSIHMHVKMTYYVKMSNDLIQVQN